MLIKAKGLHHGERLRKCSDTARLWWPYLFLAANSYGRMRLTYARFLSDVAVSFAKPPAEDEYWALFQEYMECHLAFLYQHGGEIWCQWHCVEGTLPKYHTAEDKASPEPPLEAFERWEKSYVKQTKPLPPFFQKLLKTSPKISANECHGVGVGVVRCGEGKATNRPPESPPPLSIEDIRDTLHDYVQQSGLGWPPPDDAICKKIQSLWQKGLDDFGAQLSELLKRRRKPTESYAWFVSVLKP